MTSWIIECPDQRNDRNWNIVFQVGDITNISNLLASESGLLKSCFLAEMPIGISGPSAVSCDIIDHYSELSTCAPI
jgi:hypothetical protein